MAKTLVIVPTNKVVWPISNEISNTEYILLKYIFLFMIFVSFECALKDIKSIMFCTSSWPLTNRQGCSESGWSVNGCACVTFCVGDFLKTESLIVTRFGMPNSWILIRSLFYKSAILTWLMESSHFHEKYYFA